MDEINNSYEQKKPSGASSGGLPVGFLDQLMWAMPVAKDRMNWVNVSDLKGWDNEYNIKDGIHSLLTYILVDQDGKILLRMENEVEKVVDRIEKMFNEPQKD